MVCMNMRSVLLIALLFFFAPFLMGGCASSLGGDDYSRGETRGAMAVQFATVESVRPVRIEGTKSPVGAGAGAIAGGVIGSTVGSSGSTTSAVGAVLGAVAGGLGGAAVEEGVTRQTGVEITIKLDNGGYLAVVQADKGEDFQPGERVRMVGNGRTARITR
jgi:outer membrane lipoprotein SlyB